MKRQDCSTVRLGLFLLLGLAMGWTPSSASAEEATPDGVPKCQAAAAKKPRRYGAVIELKPEKKDLYIKLHAETWPSVLEVIKRANIGNYSIFMTELDGKLYLFAYYEYTGDDFEADMEKIGEAPAMQRWWKLTDPCQRRVPGTPEGQQWKLIPEVFHTD